MKDGFDPLGKLKKDTVKKEVKEATQLDENFDKINRLNEDKIKSTLNSEGEKKITIRDILESKEPLETNNPHNYQNNVKSKMFQNYNDTYFLTRDQIKTEFEFINGENLIDYDEAYFKSDDNSLIGVIVLTDFRLLFKFRDNSVHTKMNLHSDYFKTPLFSICKIDKTNEKKNIQKYILDIHVKDSRVLKFIIQNDQLKFFANLNNLVFPRDGLYYLTFASKYKEANFIEEEDSGWSIYDALKEYTRQGIDFSDETFPVKLSKINAKFNLCPTYPELLVVPRGLNDDELKDASTFRTKNRFPVLSYMFAYCKNTTKYPSIWRSSQTKSGLTGQNRSSNDERLLKLIGLLGDKLIIYDARPYLNALANRLKGGGFENISNYSNTELYFCEIGNIHDVRASYGKLLALCNGKLMDNKKFWSSIEQTDWFNYIHLILKFANEISQSIKKGSSVLVHCSDGWDRSTQLITTAEILIDPFYRTLEGLITLIEKDWLSYGHQFGLRNGIYLKELSEDQRAPIFLQWLDCVHQLIYQFPSAFEYNLDLIIFIAENCMSNLYGTFIFNNQYERNDKDAYNKTCSIWTDVIKDRNKFTNIFYKTQGYFIVPNYAPYKVRLFEEFFLKYNHTIENNQINIGDKTVSSNLEFFTHNKIQDKIKEESLRVKTEDLYEALLDIYNKLDSKEVLLECNDKTRKIIESLIDYTEEELVEDEILDNTAKLTNNEI